MANALANDHSSRPTLRSAAIGFWKMPKLWRAPIPMVRITAPQITAIQKLRCCGLAAASEEERDMGSPTLFAAEVRSERSEMRDDTGEVGPEVAFRSIRATPAGM